MKVKLWLVAMGLLAISSTIFAAPAESTEVSTTPSTEQSTAASTANSLPSKDIERFGTALEIIKHYYVNPVTDQKIFEDAIRGMLSGLDPHSSFLNADDLRDLKDMTTGEFTGIGIEVVPQDGYLKIVSPIEGSPAQKAGIKAGDVILRVDNSLVKDITLREAVQKMRGKKGTKVVLQIARKGETAPLNIDVMRDDIHVKSVTSRLLENGYGYVRIGSFQKGTVAGLRNAVTDLKKQSKDGKLKGLVLDLRNDPGGLLDVATVVADDFLEPQHMPKNKLIVYTKSSLPNSEFSVKALDGDILHGAPIVVLINGGSASAAEIVAGALQDHKRGVIVGTNSFGKGSVQTVIPLDASSAVKLTTALYYTPSGRSIQASGIKPDVVVEDLKFTAATNNDKADDNIKEADLNKHLANGNSKDSKEKKSPGELIAEPLLPGVSPTSTQLIANDYQLFEALNILKTMVVLQSQGK